MYTYTDDSLVFVCYEFVVSADSTHNFFFLRFSVGIFIFILVASETFIKQLVEMGRKARPRGDFV